nr:hypothetical protein CFP56_45269 [Quercus suber]
MRFGVPLKPTDIDIPQWFFLYRRNLVTIETRGPGLEVTKCGAHLIFEQDIEDLKQTKPRSSSCTITPYYEDDDLGDSEKDAKIKESGDDEPPHPKWIEHPNLIENWFGNSCIQGQVEKLFVFSLVFLNQ